jgi:large subunit ribosomal protein L15
MLRHLHRLGNASPCRIYVPQYQATTTAVAVSIASLPSIQYFSAAAPASQPHQTKRQLEPVQILRLNNLHDNPGAVKKKRRIGRGIGSSKGKTSGRGHKGQKARSGSSIHPTFEGGQTPLYKLFPKRGFKNTRHAEIMNGVNLGTIQTYITMQRLDPTQPITIAAMKDAGMFKPNAVKHGIKLLSAGKEQLTHPLTIRVNRASAAAIAAVEAAGGSVVTVHLNRLALRTELRPEKFKDRPIPKHARPPPKYQPYYTSYYKRGYLNPAVQMFNWFQRMKQNNDPSVDAMETKFQQLLEMNKKKFGVQDDKDAVAEPTA